MKKSFIFILFFVSTINGWGAKSHAADAQCLQNISCQELGYTETSCFQNNGIKCPYGETYFCVCPAAYRYDCIGVNQIAAVGEACDGKYVGCECKSGYIWQEGYGCIETFECVIGSIFYADKSCSMTLNSNKTPIGVVVYVDGNGGGQVLALDTVGSDTGYAWARDYYTDIPELPLVSNAAEDFYSCENSEFIMAQGDEKQYPAVWKAHNYSTEGTNVGDWCLMAGGVADSIAKNMKVINEGLREAGGLEFTDYSELWTSTEYKSTQTTSEGVPYTYYAYCEHVNRDQLSIEKKYLSGDQTRCRVRPVLEF